MTTTHRTGLVPGAKRVLRDRVGLWPLLEARNRVLLGRHLPAWRRFENAEVRRLQAEIGELGPVLVTVVTPTYRRPEQLVASVESALAQTVTDLRVVVVD